MVNCLSATGACEGRSTKAREETIKEKQQFLDNEIENNAEQEKRISIAERTAARIRSDYQEAETQRVQFHDEVCSRHYSCSMSLVLGKLGFMHVCYMSFQISLCSMRGLIRDNTVCFNWILSEKRLV
ncbi:hypothetical protein DPMN_140806 [Dreissena polymorpha]|uniref:Uncharacterized protein n=1 Tax=Dreissena polymorpha TaxID=45954 RepID=A0A9D4JH04_DREPO|nr:hypothetical protein DPMN_140806 [Dreissena polymorpha]